MGLDLSTVLEKQKRYEAEKKAFPEVTIASYEKAFEIEYTHNSTAIEGNTLTLMETKVVLEDGISIGGKSLREIYEVVNHKKAYQYVKDCIRQGIVLDEKVVKDIHALLMENILVGGHLPQGRGHQWSKPYATTGNEMYVQIKNFFADAFGKKWLNGMNWRHGHMRSLCVSIRSLMENGKDIPPFNELTAL